MERGFPNLAGCSQCSFPLLKSWKIGNLENGHCRWVPLSLAQLAGPVDCSGKIWIGGDGEEDDLSLVNVARQYGFPHTQVNQLSGAW